jgi:MYXO-CTERM domain-containing protein
MFIATYGSSNWQYGPRNSGALVTWAGGSSGANATSAYTISLVGAQYAPEPAALALLVLAALGLRRR